MHGLVAARPGRPRLAGLTHGLLASIVEGTSDAVIAATLEDEILSWNSAAERIFGWRRFEVQDRSLSCLYPPDRASERAWIVERILAGERVEQLETIRVARDGRAVPVSITVSPLRDGEGRVFGTSSIVRDVTEHRHTDQLLRLLAEASGVLARIVDYDEARAVVSSLPLPVLADLCLVDLLEPSGQLSSLPAAHVGSSPSPSACCAPPGRASTWRRAACAPAARPSRRASTRPWSCPWRSWACAAC